MSERTVIDFSPASGGFSAAFADADGWEVVTVDIDERFGPDIQADVLDLRPSDLIAAIGEWDVLVILASPPCTTLSMANQPNPHWEGDSPTSDDVRECITLIHHAIGLIKALDPDYWILENPYKGKMGAVIGRPAGVVTYCQYGYQWQKPTGLWGDHPPMDYRRCPPGADCHQRAEGGWDTGEKRKHIRDPAERAKVPRGLSDAILEAVEEAYADPPPEQVTLGGQG